MHMADVRASDPNRKLKKQCRKPAQLFPIHSFIISELLGDVSALSRSESRVPKNKALGMLANC
jgi:hypothetical protein